MVWVQIAKMKQILSLWLFFLTFLYYFMLKLKIIISVVLYFIWNIFSDILFMIFLACIFRKIIKIRNIICKNLAFRYDRTTPTMIIHTKIRTYLVTFILFVCVSV